MRVVNIVHDSIVDGPGLRTVFFFSGCAHRCKGCHNPESWNPEYGDEWDVESLYREAVGNELCDVTFSGGDPFYQGTGIMNLAKMLKKAGKRIWCYTGYTFEEIQKRPLFKSTLEYIDVLVDGRFREAERDLTLKFKGSRNQRLIDVQKSMNESTVILWDEH
ncbi:anaerobic ribonucleoside-triphosphate reductase activating protein [Mesobacillus zeae]|uniref:Anaerobic ribonucleoside-triphosphate reductase-activating protein n=1 Tax=Mesobacillus zeae TaxID=1917180 RepID=A0A398BK87_9BACI|nr:anaerobic ribonucleoside-triphosphate reductase activating protein [Mesobacillus zeae]RID88908.1 anaerobic ribonucleoside-triphosphate reductase activating protein [Mesobacillus zeae]